MMDGVWWASGSLGAGAVVVTAAINSCAAVMKVLRAIRRALRALG